MKMRRLIMFACAFGVLASTASAKLVFEQDKIQHDAGLLEERTEAVFKFTNEGDQPVTVTGLKSTCGCTVPQLTKKDYLPGESGEIKAIFTYGARVGTQQKRITVQTDEPSDNRYTLSLITRIPEWISIEPRILRWKSGEEPKPQEIRVKVMNPSTVEVETPEGDLQHFEMEKKEAVNGELIYTIVPKSVMERSTEFLKFTARVTDGDNTRSRLFGVHCLVR